MKSLEMETRAAVLPVDMEKTAGAVGTVPVSEKPKCCPDCDGKEDGPCCVDVKKLPDSPEAPTPAFLAPVLFYEIPLDLNLPACPVAELKGIYQPFVPIRGPDSPG